MRKKRNFWLILKNPDLLHVGSNEEIVEILTGDNPDNISFIYPDNEYMDNEGRLLDLWEKPLSFHPPVPDQYRNPVSRSLSRYVY